MLIHIDYRSSTVDIAFITHHSRTIPSSVSRIRHTSIFETFCNITMIGNEFSGMQKKLKKQKTKSL